MDTAVKVSTSVTMFSIEEARQQLEAYKNGTLDVEPINLSNVENMLKSMGDYETLVKLIKGTKENGQDSHLQYIDDEYHHGRHKAYRKGGTFYLHGCTNGIVIFALVLFAFNCVFIIGVRELKNE